MDLLTKGIMEIGKHFRLLMLANQEYCLAYYIICCHYNYYVVSKISSMCYIAGNTHMV